jgi:hypothetical protein
MSSEDETDFVPTPAEESYPPNNYSIAAPEDPVFFATQQVEPVTPAPEDPSVTPTTFISDIVPIPISEAEGLTDAFVATDPSGAELPPSTTLTGLFPNNVVFEGGVVCTLTGTALDLVSEIRIVGTIVPFVLINPGTIQFTTPVAPDNSGGTKNVEVYDAFGVLQGSVPITYAAQVAVFGVSSVVPNSGTILGGQEIILYGSAFYFIANVTIDNEPVYNFEILNSTAIKIVTPPGLFTGNPVDIKVTSFDGSVRTLAASYTFTYPAPFLLGLDMNSADISGGTQVEIAGAFLTGATSVLVDGNPVTSFTTVNEGKITFETAPSVFTGIPLDVTVTTPYGSDTLFGAFTYSTTAPVPKITSVSPPKGLIGTFAPVTITGSGFTGTIQVEFDGVAANSFTVVSDTKITCTAPFGSYNGGFAVNVKVTTMDGSFTKVGAFTFVYDVPTLSSTSLTTDLVAGGTPGTLTGTNFYEVSAVTIAGVPVQSFAIISPTQINYVTGTAPNDNTLPGDIQVITAFGIATLANVFTYTYPPVSVTSINIGSGFASGGMTVVLTGSGFTLVTQVLLAGVAVSSFTVDSLTQITCVTGPNSNPTNTPGNVVVQTVFTEAILPNAFTYVATMQLTSSSASNGVTTGGEVVTLTGVDFANIQTIFFAGTAAASFTILNSTTIQAITGFANTYGVLGNITIVTTFGENIVLPNAFIYYPALFVTSINIDKGLSSGNQVRTLTGTGFYDVTNVSLCGVNVTSFTVNTPTSMSITIAPNATLGTGDIVVTTTYTSYNLANSFTYYPGMSISSVSVSNGPSTGGTTVVVTGSGFFQVNSVQFIGTEVASLTVNSLTQITVTTASKTISDGELGDVIVTSPYTSDTLSNAWTYWPTMNVVSLDVSNGLTTGGTTVVITGSGFYAVTDVRFNNISAASYTVNSPTQITAVTGIGALNGTGNVVVDSIYTSATKTNAWTYYQPMTVSTLSVTNGPRAGGTSVVITGAGFYSVTGVTFNGVTVTSYTVNSLTQITVSTGAKPSSNGDVGDVVVTSSFTSGTGTNLWTYYPPMSVTSLDTSNGPKAGGTTVVITGAGFYSVTGVTFNGVAVTSYTVNSVTQITVVTGAKPSSTGDVGNVVVTSAYTSATGSNLWTYFSPVVVTSLDVSNGPRAGGTSVVVTGSGFYSVTGVTFNGVAVTSYTVDSLTQITVTTAAKPSSNGDVGNVVVTTSFTSGTGTNLWTYYPPMSVTSIDVQNGITTGGSTVVITGAGFYSLTGITFIGAAVSSFTVDSLTQITATTGTSTITSPTTGNVVVTSNFTSATGTNLWLYYPPIVVTSLDVSYGQVSGGTTVTITGSGFYNVNSVTFKGIEVLTKTINSPTSITVVTKGDVSQLLSRVATGLNSNLVGQAPYPVWAGGSINKFFTFGSYVYPSGPDGVSFTTANVPTPGSLRFAHYEPSLNKVFVLGNGNFANRFLESSDGVTFTSPGVLPVNYPWNYFAYSPTLDVFVCVARPSNVGSNLLTPIATSTDRGATWTLYGTGTARSFATVTWCSGFNKFIATGFTNVNVTNSVIAYSADGITWTEVDLTTQISGNVQMTQWAGYSEDTSTLFVTGDTYGFVTTDGLNWTRTPSVLPGTTYIVQPTWIQSLGVFVGQSGTDQYAYSSDGLTWTTISSTDVSGVTKNGLAWSAEWDALFTASSSANVYTFTNPENATGDVVVTSTYTSGTKSNAYTFSPKIAIGSVDLGFGPTVGGTTIKIYGRGFRNVTSVTLKNVNVASFSASTDGTVLTVVSAAGTAGTGDIVVSSPYRSATLTNGWSYKNVTVNTYDYDTISTPAKNSLTILLHTRPVLSTYTGPLFRVLRSSDLAITEVYGTSGDSSSWFTANGIGLSTWKGIATLRIVRWFDQSGSTASSDAAVPKPPGSGTVFAYMYQPDKMPVLDVTTSGPNFNGAGYCMNLANGVTPAVSSAFTITVRHGTIGNSTNGELFNIGTNTNTAPGSGNYLRRQGSNYINTWPGVNTLTLTGAYTNNQVVTITNDLTNRTGYVQGTSVASLAGTLAGNTNAPSIGGRTDGTVDSLAQILIFAAASTVFGTSDLAVLEDAASYTLPVITSVNTASGPTTGGTTVVITGTGFTGATAVAFGGTSATSYTVDSSTQITAVTAAGSAGRGNITVTNSAGTNTFTNGWIYYQTNYTRFFAVTDISSTTGLNKSANSFFNTVTYSSALGVFIVADSDATGITQPYVTSSNGTTWTRQTAPVVSGNDTINDIACSNTAIVSCGVFPVIRRSTNGTTWTNVTSSNTLTFRIAYSPTLSRFVIGRGNNNGLYYSNDDGATWSAATGAAVFVANVLWNSGTNEFYVFIRNGGSVYRSSTGTSYTLAASSLASDNYHAAAYSSDRNEMMTVGNNSSNVYASTDGTTWTLKTTLSGTIVVGLTWNSELGVYVGCTNKGLYTTIDGTVWTAMNPLVWSGTFDYSWGRWVYNPTAHVGVAAYVNTVFRTEATVRASLSFAASQNVQITNDVDLRPGTGDFTVEWFQYQTAPSAGTTPYVFSIANDLAVSVNGSTGLWSVYVGGSAVLTHTPTDVYGRWCHFAITRTGTTLGLFKDGNRLTTVTNSTNIANTTDVLRIANSSTTSGTNQFLGRMTNFHFVKGTAVYTGTTYTVPTREIFAIANSKVLLPTPNGNLVGNYSGVAKTITNNSATSSSENPFYL